ncbi:MAG TPA: antitoxin Xre/MbcA/ParS toxin-binding domain-containing protein [Gammaproteobacteria bacterium]
MESNVSDMIMASIYNEWELDADDRKMIDEMGLEGAEAICAMHVALGHMFAHNPQLAALWPTTPNKALNNLAPMDVIRRDGMAGLRRVRGFLDLTW